MSLDNNITHYFHDSLFSSQREKTDLADLGIIYRVDNKFK